MVFQNPEDQIITTIVEEDVAFGLENMGLPPQEIRDRSRAALEEVHLWEERKRPPNLLSAGQLQRLALAGVIAMHPRCVIFDEATTMLDPVGRKVALDAMKRMNGQGVTVIFITHFMEESVEAKRILLLQNGSIHLDGTPLEVFHDPQLIADANLELPFARRMSENLCRLIPEFPTEILTLDSLVQSTLEIWKKRGIERNPTVSDESKQTYQTPDGNNLVDVENLSHVYLKGTPLEKLALTSVSLRVGKGDSHGLAGITGSGKSTLLQHLNGLLRPQTGSVRIGAFNLNDPKTSMRSVIQLAGLVFQNPEMQFFEQFVGDEIAYGPQTARVEGWIIRTCALGNGNSGVGFQSI